MASASRTAGIAPAVPELGGALRLAGIGLAIAAVGAIVQFIDLGSVSNCVALALGIAGTVIAGLAIVARPNDSRLLGIAVLTAAAGFLCAHSSWGSIRLLFGVMAMVAAVAAILFMVSRTTRLVVVSVLLLYHFAGVLSAITSPPPTPWLTSQAWVRLFRPHLEFCYVNNAYQFYSPEPGPANLLWFCILGDDNQIRWLKVPNSDEKYDPLGVEYYRRLSLTERVNSNEFLIAGPPEDAIYRRTQIINEYPWFPEAAPAMQYRMPDENSRQFLRSYVRHVAKTHGSGRPGVGVKSIKVYLTQHRLLSQFQYANKVDPYDKASYLPFFVGDYDPTGRLLNPFDPLLYWIVPIIKVPKYDNESGKQIGYEYQNFVTAHAGGDPFESP